MSIDVKEYNTGFVPTWCPGCGNYSIHVALKKALSELNISPKETMIAFDIGCNGNGAENINTYRFKGLHGRSIPLAVGAHLANRKYTVISDIGDGGVLHEGVEHLVHAIRSNYDITILIHNNQNFALTTGQATATTQDGKPMYALPDGKPERSMQIWELVLALNPTFYARTFSGDLQQMTTVVKEGIKHKGCSVIEVMQYCPTYNPECDIKWFKERIRVLENTNDNPTKARELMEQQDVLNTGIILQQKGIHTFYDNLQSRKGKNTELVNEVKPFDIKNLLKKYQ